MSNLPAHRGQVDGTIVPANQKYGMDDFGAMASASSYLPRLQLFGSSSNEVKEGKVSMGVFAIVTGKDKIIELGKEFDCCPVTWRPKAMDISDLNNIINSHDRTSDVFQRIMKESEIQNSGCMFGPEFLIWIPGHDKFVTYFANSKTARNAAGPLRELFGKAVTFKVKFIKTEKYSWHGPEFFPCSTPLSSLPDPDDVTVEVDKFENPPVKAEPEVAAPASNRPR